MTRPNLVICLLVQATLLNSTVISLADDGTRDETQRFGQAEIHKLVQNSLPYIDRAGRTWRKNKQCLSCHRGTFTVWAINRAAEVGVPGSTEKLADWNEWAMDWQSLLADDRRADAKRDEVLSNENDAVGQLLLARSRLPSHQSKVIADYRSALETSQQDDGSWKAGGQLPSQKRPKIETQQVSTMWSLIALAEYDQSLAAVNSTITPSQQQAMDWLNKTKPERPESTEWWATRMLLASLTPDDAIGPWKTQLLELQREDGGWGWLHKDKSDALATGIALYALANVGLGIENPQIQRAIRFLGESQQSSGRWNVHGTKKNRAKNVAETASYWGTCWAVIGILEFLTPEHTQS